MSMVRRLTRRPTAGGADTIIPPTALTADEVAYRIGVAGAPVPPPGSEAFVPPPVDRCGGRRGSSEGGLRQPGRSAHRRSGRDDAGGLDPRTARAGLAPGAPDGAASPRVRLVRDAAVALIGLVVVGLVVLNFFPQRSPVAPPSSTQFVSVVEESPTPEPTAKPTATQAAAVATASPTPSPTPLVAATPAPHAKTDTQADQGRPALHPEADGAPDRGAHASANAEADAEAHRETDPQADAGARRGPHLGGLMHGAGWLIRSTAKDRHGRARLTAGTSMMASAVGANPPANPVHSFDGSQTTYTVILTVTGPGGSDSTFKVIDVPC